VDVLRLVVVVVLVRLNGEVETSGVTQKLHSTALHGMEWNGYRQGKQSPKTAHTKNLPTLHLFLFDSKIRPRFALGCVMAIVVAGLIEWLMDGRAWLQRHTPGGIKTAWRPRFWLEMPSQRSRKKPP